MPLLEAIMIERMQIRTLLEESMKELMNTKPLQKITVQMILENCSVSRPTFYNYFFDKYDLINQIFKKNVDTLAKGRSARSNWSVAIGNMLAHMKKEQVFYTNAVSYHGQNSFIEFLDEHIYVTYINELSKLVGPENLDNEILFSLKFNSHGAARTIFEWIKSEMSEDPYQLGRLLANNMTSHIRQYFKLDEVV